MSVLEMKEGNVARLTITVEKDAFVKALNDAYHKTASRYPVPGFRKGKAPRKVIEANYGAMVFYDEAFDLCWAEPYDAAVKEHNLVPVDRPSVVEMPVMSEQEGVTYVAEVQLKPEVTLGQYKGIAVKKLAYTVTDEEVDNALKMEQQKQVRYEDVDRPVENGDRIILDYCGKVDGVAFEGGTAQDQTLDIGSHTFIPGFEEQLVGVNPGEEKDIHVTFPEEYHAENLKGKAAVFKCEVHEVKEKQTPELDDDFAGDKGFDTVDEYKADVREKLAERKAEAAKNKKENDVLEKLIEGAEMDIPEAMISSQVEQSIDEYAQQLRRQGLSLDQYFMFTGLNREKMAENSRPGIEKRIKSRLVLEAVAKAEGIVASDEDYEKELNEMAEQYKLEVENIKGMIRPQDEKMMRKDIEIQKALDFVVENAKEI